MKRCIVIMSILFSTQVLYPANQTDKPCEHVRENDFYELDQFMEEVDFSTMFEIEQPSSLVVAIRELTTPVCVAVLSMFETLKEKWHYMCHYVSQRHNAIEKK